MKPLIIKQSTIVNEGRSFIADIIIEDDLIRDIGHFGVIKDYDVIDGRGKYLLPGIIDTHVHFRDPGLTYKGDIYSESKAAIAGGVTSFIDMPNTIPNTMTADQLKVKAGIASKSSLANYSFYLGISTGNYSDLLQLDRNRIAAITDDGLYFSGKGNMLCNNPDFMEKLFSSSDSIISIHSEEEEIIDRNIAAAICKYGDKIPIEMHGLIRSEEACYISTYRAIQFAKKHKTRLHLLHLSTAKEAQLFENGLPITEKRITSEVCIHHLWFCDEDYKKLGTAIKWNPSIKTKHDRSALLEALNDDRIDIVSTDHAPHTLAEKQKDYLNAPSGGPMVQHSLVAMLELVKRKTITIEKLVDKMSHNAALLYKIHNRGFIRPGYYADLVLVDLNSKWTVNENNILYKCGWSPFNGHTFSSMVCTTIVNGNIVYNNGVFNESIMGKPLSFNNTIKTEKTDNEL
ncbi:MAG: dihydroorotase [Taibaiella sp.]|nr:dihydroorotase [Taibaiella sp.]